MDETLKSKIKYFENIPAVPNKDRILSRLGYRNGVTELKASDLSLIEDCVKQGTYLCQPSGAYINIAIKEKSVSGVVLDNNISLMSESLSKLLKDSHSVILMAATVGHEVSKKVFTEIEKGNASAGLILDSVASQTADAALDWLVQMLNKMLIREGKKLTKHRYSPGFGDLPLLYQKDIFEALELFRLNMALTEKFMLIPEKSVIAIAGVEDKGELNI